jgi:hypothetical protein
VRHAALALLAGLALAGCESTQATSARLARQAKAVAAEHGVTVTRGNPDVRVLDTRWIRDRYGVAVVVELRSRADRPQADLPLAFTVQGPGGRREYANSLAGLDDSLTHVPLLRAGEHAFWVDDQVQVRQPKKVVAKVGVSHAHLPQHLPELAPTRLSLQDDPDGIYTRGMLRNRSGIDQRNVTVYGVAERGGRVVAAGRGGIERIAAHEQALFRVFWIGDPRGARVRLFAPPTTLEQEG